MVVSRAGEVGSVPPSTLRCLLISDVRLVQYPGEDGVINMNRNVHRFYIKLLTV